MLKLFWISILLTLIYSWEEFKHAARTFAYGLLQKNPPRFYLSRADQFVGTIIFTATVPICLMFMLVSEQNLYFKLLWLAGGLLLVSLLAAGSGIFIRRLRIAQNTEGAEKIIPFAYSVLGLFSPLFQIFSGIGSGQRLALAKLTFFLSLPALLGLVFKYSLDYSASEIYLPNADALVVVLVGAVIIRITVEFLEQAFRLYRLESLFSYFRVLLGIVLAATLGAGLL